MIHLLRGLIIKEQNQSTDFDFFEDLSDITVEYIGLKINSLQTRLQRSVVVIRV